MENENVKEQLWKEEIYFHVCNGGATISIEQSEYGAKIKFRTGSYGNCETTTEVTTNNRGIETLKGMFERASKNDFKVNDCYSLAYVPNERSGDETMECGQGSDYISEELIPHSPKAVESTKEQELQSALIDISIQMKEMAFFNTKLAYVTKILMGPKNFTAEEKIELCKKFDVTSDIQEAKKIYEEYINLNKNEK